MDKTKYVIDNLLFRLERKEKSFKFGFNLEPILLIIVGAIFGFFFESLLFILGLMLVIHILGMIWPSRFGYTKMETDESASIQHESD